jgi:hypothetical protein
MPRTALTLQEIVPAGLAPSYAAGDAANGHSASAGYDVFLHVKNVGGGSCTVTLNSTARIGGVALANQTVVVPATTGDKMIPLRPDLYAQSDGLAYVDLSTATGVTVAVIRLRP